MDTSGRKRFKNSDLRRIMLKLILEPLTKLFVRQFTILRNHCSTFKVLYIPHW